MLRCKANNIAFDNLFHLEEKSYFVIMILCLHEYLLYMLISLLLLRLIDLKLLQVKEILRDMICLTNWRGNAKALM